MSKTLDISSKADWPSCALSNFAKHHFEIDGVFCYSMESFLQSLKFSDPIRQIEVCGLDGYSAYLQGRKVNWVKGQTLYWNGKAYKRESKDYQELLDSAYAQLFGNLDFQKALRETGDLILTHKIGKHNMLYTILTVEEFCFRLTEMRKYLLNTY